MPVSAFVDHCQRMTHLFSRSLPGLSQDIEAVSAFYTASLWDLVGEGYHSPSLPFLATAWVCYPGVYYFFSIFAKP